MNGLTDRETLRVGIVGCGSIARAHALSYQNNAHVELVGVVDVDPVRAAGFAEHYGTTAYGSCRELLDHQPDLVSVATPPGNHTEVAVELLESGCSVLLEKPPATTLADMDVLAAAEKAELGLRSMWCFSTVMDRARVAPTICCIQARWELRG